MATEKIMHSLKVEGYVLFRDITEDYILGNSLSDSSEEQFQRGKGGARIYGSFSWKKTHVVKHQKLPIITKNKCLKVMILVLFYVWEDARVWAH